jgi:hypothetical protein
MQQQSVIPTRHASDPTNTYSLLAPGIGSANKQ